MGFLDLFKPKPDTPKKSTVRLWLESADEAYEFALHRRLTSGLASFFKGDALKYLMSKVNHLTEDEDDLSEYRNVDFVKLKTKDGSTKYKRKVTFEDIHISKNVCVPLGTPYAEKWTLSEDGTNTITNIERCEK